MRLHSCGVQVYMACSINSIFPRLRMEPVSPALVGGFSTTDYQGSPAFLSLCKAHLCRPWNVSPKIWKGRGTGICLNTESIRLGQLDKALWFVNLLHSHQGEVTHESLPVEKMWSKRFFRDDTIPSWSPSRGPWKSCYVKDWSKRKQNAYHGMPAVKLTS